MSLVLALMAGLVVGFAISRLARVLRPQPGAPALSTASISSFGRAMGGSVGQRRQLSLPHLQRSVFSELIRNVLPGADGVPEVPARFLVLLHPDDANRVADAERWFTGDLVKALEGAATGQGWRMLARPAIEVLADVNRRPGVPRVEPAPVDGAEGPGTAPDAALSGLGPGMAFLVRLGESPVVRHPLRGNEVTIGRGTDQGIRIDDPRASRAHGLLRQTSKGWIYIDAGSSNGSRVNGQPTTPHDAVLLRNQDQIAIGEARFRFEHQGGAAGSLDKGTADRDAEIPPQTRERLTAQYLPEAGRGRGRP